MIDSYLAFAEAKVQSVAVQDRAGRLLGWSRAFAALYDLPDRCPEPVLRASVIPEPMERTAVKLCGLAWDHGRVEATLSSAAPSFRRAVVFRVQDLIAAEFEDASSEPFRQEARRRFGIDERAATILARLALDSDRGARFAPRLLATGVGVPVPELEQTLEKLVGLKAVEVKAAGEDRFVSVPWFEAWKQSTVRLGPPPPVPLSLGGLTSKDPESPLQVAAVAAGLTRREAQVAALACDGRSNPDIAEELGLSPHTVKEYLGKVYRKLGVRGRGQLSTRLLDPEIRSSRRLRRAEGP